MEPKLPEAVARAIAFANGLRKNITVTGRRWTRWPGGADDLAKVVASIDGSLSRLQSATRAGDPEAAAVACIAELRAVLEWTQYQSANLATAQAVVATRRLEAFAERFGLLDVLAASRPELAASEHALIENIRTRNGYMNELAGRYPQLALPHPLVDVAHLSEKPARLPRRLLLMRQLTKRAKERPPR